MSAAEVQTIITSLSDLEATKMTQLSAMILLAYDFILSFPQEVELFWKPKGWSPIRIMFFANRYWSIVIIVFNTIATLSPYVNDAFCNAFTRTIIGATGAVEIFIVQIILSLRVFALYGRSWYIAGFLAFIWLGSAVSAVVIVHISLAPVIITSTPLPGVKACSPTSTPQNIWAFYIPIIIYDSIVFILAGTKAWQHRTSLGGAKSFSTKIIEVMLRDSLAYFFCISILFIADVLIWRFARPSMLNIIHGYTFGTAALLASRMLLNLKQQGIRDDDRSTFQMNTWNTAAPQISVTVNQYKDTWTTDPVKGPSSPLPGSTWTSA